MSQRALTVAESVFVLAGRCKRPFAMGPSHRESEFDWGFAIPRIGWTVDEGVDFASREDLGSHFFQIPPPTPLPVSPSSTP